MKKLALLVFLVTSALITFGQNVDADRVNARNFLGVPLNDTVNQPIKIGELRTRPQDSAMYRFNGRLSGRRWDKQSASFNPALSDVLLNGNSAPSQGIVVGFIKLPNLASGSPKVAIILTDGTVSTGTLQTVHGTFGYALYYAPDGSGYTFPVKYDSNNNQIQFERVINLPAGFLTGKAYDINSIVDNSKTIGYQFSGTTINTFTTISATISAVQGIHNSLSNTYVGGPDASHLNGSAGYNTRVSQDSADAYINFQAVTAGGWRHGFDIGYTTKFGKAEWAIAYQNAQANGTFYGSRQLMGMDSIGDIRFPSYLQQNVDSVNWKPVGMDINGHIRRMTGWAPGTGGTGISLTSLTANAPISYNNSTGVFSADTSAGVTHFATKGNLNSYVNKTTDTAAWHTVGFYDLRYAGSVPALTQNQIAFGDAANAQTSSSNYLFNTHAMFNLGGANTYTGTWAANTAANILGSGNTIPNNNTQVNINGNNNTLVSTTNTSGVGNHIVGSSNTLGFAAETTIISGNVLGGTSNVLRGGSFNVVAGNTNQLNGVGGAYSSGAAVFGVGNIDNSGAAVAKFGQFGNPLASLRVAYGNGTSSGATNDLWDIDLNGNMFLTPGNTAARPVTGLRPGTFRINTDSAYRGEVYNGSAWNAWGVSSFDTVTTFATKYWVNSLRDTLKIGHKGTGKWHTYASVNYDTLYDKTEIDGYAFITTNNADSSMTHKVDTSLVVSKIYFAAHINDAVPVLTNHFIAVGNPSNQISGSSALQYNTFGGSAAYLNIGVTGAGVNIDPSNGNYGIPYSGHILGTAVTVMGFQSNFGGNAFQIGNTGMGAYVASNAGNVASYNTAFGDQALGAVVDSFNIAIGYRSGDSLQSTLSKRNIFLGNSNGKKSTATVLQNTYIFGDSVRNDSSNLVIVGRNDQRILLGNGGGNTAAMNALHNGIVGAIFFNTDSTTTGSGYCSWIGTKWLNIGAGNGGGTGIPDSSVFATKYYISTLKDTLKIAHQGIGKWHIYANATYDTLFDKTERDGYGFITTNIADSSMVHQVDTSVIVYKSYLATHGQAHGTVGNFLYFAPDGSSSTTNLKYDTTNFQYLVGNNYSFNIVNGVTNALYFSGGFSAVNTTTHNTGTVSSGGVSSANTSTGFKSSIGPTSAQIGSLFTSPAAILDLGVGGTVPSSGQLRFQDGFNTMLATPVKGLLEFSTGLLYLTDSISTGVVRSPVATQSWVTANFTGGGSGLSGLTTNQMVYATGATTVATSANYQVDVTNKSFATYHYGGLGSQPTTNSLGGNVSSATVQTNGTDAGFQVIMVTTGNVTGTLFGIAFANAFVNAPVVTVCTADAVTGQTIGSTTAGYVSCNAGTGSGAVVTGTITGAGTYKFNFITSGK